MDGELPRSGHSYFGTVNSAQEAHAILEASKLGLLPRVTRRLTDEERLSFVRAGAVFVWEEEEAGIRRWTDHIKWSPSRVSGAFLTYTEVPSRGEESLIKQSFSSVDASGTKMHLIAYTSKSAFNSGTLPSATQDPLIQRMLVQRSGGRDPREQPSLASPPSTASASTSQPPPRLGAGPPPPPPASVAPAHFPHLDFRRPHSTSFACDTLKRPRSSSAAENERPLTSASEPRPSSSYDSHPYRTTTPASLSFPSLGHHRAGIPTSVPLSAASSPVPAPPYPWPFAYDADRAAASSAASSRLPSFFNSPAQPVTSSFGGSPRPPSSANSTTTTASPFDPFPRQLPPLDGLAPYGGEHPSLRPPHLEENGEAEQNADERGSIPRQPGRGSEDERQLRLLGRSF
ncbi:hypothetical protein JCM10207_006605 [Rhodosporidiobolus poonsookiae]